MAVRQRTPHRLLTATAAPAMTWLPLNVAIVDNVDREVTARAHIGRARLELVRNTGAFKYRLDTCKVAAVARDVLLSESERARRWH